jgi:hypothetical protein
LAIAPTTYHNVRLLLHLARYPVCRIANPGLDDSSHTYHPPSPPTPLWFIMLGRALPRALATLLLTAATAATAAAAPSPYDFKDNYREKAPSPETGPSASFHATRERSRLPYEICGIVGGYLFTVLIWGLLLITVGRTMRRKALNPPKALELEMEPKLVRPPVQQAPPTPMSARSATSWLKKFKKGDSIAGSTPVSPIVQSPTSFDQTVLDANKERAQAEMERLYAAVMDHDAKKHSRHGSTEDAAPAPHEHRRRPSALSTDTTPISPIRAIYPPSYPNMQPPQPLPRNSLRDRDSNTTVPASPRSILKRPNHTPKSPRFNLKNLRISAPIQSYGGASPTDEARTPLSPRFYPDPGVPPSPPTQETSPITPPLPAPSLRPIASPRRPRDLNLTISPPPAPVPKITVGTPSQRSATATPTSSLPFRAYTSTTPVSPGIQTTILSHDPAKHSLQTPRTGVPFTPYTPYMPFTPVTPVTPHLVTRRERREKKKEGRGLRGVQEEIMVQSPKEIFGEAY